MTTIQTVVIPTTIIGAGSSVIAVQTSVASVSGSTDNNDGKLNTGWVLAIVFMVMFSIAITVILVMFRKLRHLKRGLSRSNYERSNSSNFGSEEYILDRPRPSRVRNDSNGGYGDYGYNDSRPRTWFRR